MRRALILLATACVATGISEPSQAEVPNLGWLEGHIDQGYRHSILYRWAYSVEKLRNQKYENFRLKRVT